MGACMRIGAITAVALSLSLAVAARGQEASPPPSPPSEASPPPHHLAACPDNVADFENSDATQKLVRKCMGAPDRVMPGHGSDVVWFYSAKGGAIMLVLVFDKTGALTHFRAYAKTDP